MNMRPGSRYPNVGKPIRRASAVILYGLMRVRAILFRPDSLFPLSRLDDGKMRLDTTSCRKSNHFTVVFYEGTP
jgi:hypothetical protein